MAAPVAFEEHEEVFHGLNMRLAIEAHLKWKDRLLMVIERSSAEGIGVGVVAADGKHDLPEAQRRLEHFRIALQDHLLKENVRLYVYLEHLLQADAQSRELIHEFRREMDGIGRVVVGFLTRYKLIASQPELAATFAPELDQIALALVARIEREEATLYPLYGPPRT